MSEFPICEVNVDVEEAAGAVGFVTMEPKSVRRRLYTEEVLDMWNLVKVSRQLGTREQCITFCENYGLIPASKMCNRHRIPMRIQLRGQLAGNFYCNKASCIGRTISRQDNTWFENAKISMPRIFYLMYAFAMDWSFKVTVREDFTKDAQTGILAQNTITDWFNYCREVIVIDYLDNMRFSGMIGGPGIVVQIDESKFGRRKYNRGRQIEGHWVVGMVEQGSRNIRLEVCPNNEGTADSLLSLIRKHVAPGSIIHTDCWSAYNDLQNFCVYGYTHKKVNHSDPENPFVAEDGTHTQQIKSQWRVIKNYYKNRRIPHDHFADSIVEYQWRYHQEVNKLDPFESLLQIVKTVYPGR